MYLYNFRLHKNGGWVQEELMLPKLYSFYELIKYVYLEKDLDEKRPLNTLSRERLNQLALEQGFEDVTVYRNHKNPVKIWSANKEKVLRSLNTFKQLEETLSKAPRVIDVFPHGFTDTNLWGDLTLIISTEEGEKRFLMTYFARDVFRSPRYAKLVTEGDLFHDPELDWDTHIISSPIRKPSEYPDIVREWIQQTFPEHSHEHTFDLYPAYWTNIP